MTQRDSVIQVFPKAEGILLFHTNVQTRQLPQGRPGWFSGQTAQLMYSLEVSSTPRGSLPGVLGSVCHSETLPVPAQMARAGLSPGSLPQEEHGQTALNTSPYGYK